MNLRNCILGISIFVGVQAVAHIDEGVWEGKSETGVACSMTVGKQTFENNMPHPLNERIEVKVEDDVYSVYHPRIIDSATAKAGFDHDHFHGVLATPTGAKAIVIDMAHTAEFKGPTAFHSINHDYKSSQRSVLHCTDIKRK